MCHDVGVKRTAEVAGPLKVPYDFFSGVGPELRHPGGALPGANRWDVPPASEHPTPVILMHGTAGGAQTNWGTYVPLLTNEGFSVFTMTYGALDHVMWPLSALGGMKRIEDSAVQFGHFVEKVLAATGASQVDVVGHSQGTIVPNYWAKFLGGADRIRRYVSLAPLWNGTETLLRTHTLYGEVASRLGFRLALPCYSATQMLVGSDFIAKLNSGGGPYVPGIEYTNISTSRDEVVRPYTSGQVPGGPADAVTNIVVQQDCSRDRSDHLAICGSRRASLMVLNALDDGDRAVPCEIVVPFFGASV